MEGRFEAREDGAEEFACAGEPFKGFDVGVKIGRPGCADGERVDLAMTEAEEVVEGHGMEGLAQAGELFGRRVEFSALIGGGNDEDAHVALGSGLNGGGVFLKDPVPVEVDVIEAAVVGMVDEGEEEVGGGVCGEADVFGAALALELASGAEASAAAIGAEGFLRDVVVIDAVEGEEVDVVEAEAFEGFIEVFEEEGGVGLGDDFSLDDELFAGEGREHEAELAFRGAISASGFDVGDAEIPGAADGGLEVGLVFGGDLFEGCILPFPLEAHAAAGEEGHHEARASKPAVLHGALLPNSVAPPMMRGCAGSVKPAGDGWGGDGGSSECGERR